MVRVLKVEVVGLHELKLLNDRIKQQLTNALRLSACTTQIHYTTLLRSVTCHMGSHSITCHPTQANVPHQTDRFTYHDGMES